MKNFRKFEFGRVNVLVCQSVFVDPSELRIKKTLTTQSFYPYLGDSIGNPKFPRTFNLVQLVNGDYAVQVVDAAFEPHGNWTVFDRVGDAQNAFTTDVGKYRRSSMWEAAA